MAGGRLDREIQHWNAVASRELLADSALLRVDREDLVDRTKDWLPFIDLSQLTQHLISRLGDVRNKHILELGTGNGFLAVALALRGAKVTAVDLSPVSLDVARRRARMSGVADQISFSLMAAEKLELCPASFDAACGIFVLHHTDLETTSAELGRVLRPGALAVFIETMAFNPLLMAARRHITGRFGVEKASSDDEAPIGPAGLLRLRAGFPGLVSIEWPSLVFLRMLSYVRFFRSPSLRPLLRSADHAVARFPTLRRMSYFGVVVMKSQQFLQDRQSQTDLFKDGYVHLKPNERDRHSLMADDLEALSGRCGRPSFLHSKQPGGMGGRARSASAPSGERPRNLKLAARNFTSQMVMSAAAGIARTAIGSRGEGCGLVSILIHGLGMDKEEEFGDRVDPMHPMTVADFAATVQSFKAANYQFIGPEDVLAGLKPDGHYVWLTLDDGYASSLRALPVLEKANAKATFYVASDNVKTGQGFWWDAYWREMRKEGHSSAEIERRREKLKAKHWKEIETELVDRWGYKAFDPVSDRDRPMSSAELKALAVHRCASIGNHTRNHAILTCLTADEVTEQMEGCQRDIEAMTGSVPISIAYPNGCYNDRIVASAVALGLQFGHGCFGGRDRTPLDGKSNLILKRDVVRNGVGVATQCDAIRLSLRRFV